MKKNIKKIICVNLCKSVSKKAFTLIELLTVIAIISMLIAIFGVGMRKIKIIQKNLQQKAEMKSMEVGLHLFSSDFHEFPDSQQVISGTTVTGAQRLAEALLGRDQLGFHPKSKWHPALEPASPDVLYDISVNDTTKQRKPEYTELKECGFYQVDDLWTSPGTIETATPVITDVFRQNRDTASGEKTGMPILYFKADETKRFRVDSTNTLVTNPAPADYSQWVYNFDDNRLILELPWLRETAADTDTPEVISPHYVEDPDDPATQAVEVFYRSLTLRENAAAGIYKPFNRDTFVLISAGYDGIYGTKDDITNFNY